VGETCIILGAGFSVDVSDGSGGCWVRTGWWFDLICCWGEAGWRPGGKELDLYYAAFGVEVVTGCWGDDHSSKFGKLGGICEIRAPRWCLCSRPSFPWQLQRENSFDAFSFGWEHPEPSRFYLIAHIENIKLILSFSGLARGGKSNWLYWRTTKSALCSLCTQLFQRVRMRVNKSQRIQEVQVNSGKYRVQHERNQQDFWFWRSLDHIIFVL
jgi:hypothetical protein